MKPRHRIIVLLSLLCAHLFPIFEAAAQELEVSGRVVDADGSPVAEATVQLVPLVGSYLAGLDELAGRHQTEAKVETRTNRRGSYLLKAPEAGMWWVRVEAKGFVSMGQRLMPLLADAEVPTARLVPARSTTVVIRGEEGKPLSGALVSATNDQRRRDDEWWLQRFYGLTDENGQVRIPHPEESRLAVFAHHPNYLEGQQESVKGTASLTLKRGKLQPIVVQDHRGKPLPDVLVRVGEGNFPLGTTDPEGRIAVVTKEDGDQGLRLLAPDLRSWVGGLRANPGEPPAVDVLKLPALTTLEGRVVEITRRDPVPGGLVWLGNRAETLVRSDSRGGFRISLPNMGSLWLQAAAPGYFTSSVEVKDGAERAPTVVLEPSLVVPGRVVNEDGEPLAEVEVEATFLPGSSRTSQTTWQSGGRVRSDARGVFLLRQLAPKASYHLAFSLPGYARTLRRIEAPKPGEPFELEVEMPWGRVAFGLVVDAEEQPLDGAEIVLNRQEAGQTPMQIVRISSRQGETPDGRAISQQNGRFEVADLGPGRYRLEVGRSGFAPTVVPGIEIPETSPPEGFDLGTLVLIPGFDLEGRVVDGEGEPLAGAKIYVQSQDLGNIFSSRRGNRREPFAVAGQDGRFLVPDHRAGERLDLTVAHPGYVNSQLVGVEVPTADPLVVVLRPASSLAGRVVTQGGAPIPGAKVSALIEQAGERWSSQQSQSARTKADGTFTIENLEAGIAHLTAQGEEHGRGELSGIEIAEGKNLEGLVITLQPGTILRGVVLGPTGQPVPEVVVMETQQGQFGGGHYEATMTDGDGHFQLNGIKPGKRTIKARHKGFQATSKTLEITSGENFLELRLGGGQTIRGQVVGAENLPLPGTIVQLKGLENRYQQRETNTDHLGRFEFDNVVDGTYKMEASHPEHASSQLPDEVVVAGGPVDGLLFQLEKGAVITGRLLGLEFDELAQVQVFAHSQLGMRLGEVDFEARYRVPGAGQGEWNVSAQSPNGRQAQGQTTVEPGDHELELDLEFKDGHTLSGRIFHGEQPLDGAHIQLSGVDARTHGSGRSDHLGHYQITGLAAGRYQVQAYGQRTALTYREEIEITGSQSHDIVLEGSRVVGRVLAAPTGTPLAGVRFSVEPLGDGNRFSLYNDRSQSNTQGLFDLGELTPGRWRVRAQKEGYAQAATEVEVRLNSDPPPLELTLSPTEGLWLTVHGPGTSGHTGKQVFLALLDSQGQPVATANSAMDSDGQVHFATAPAGSWRLLVASDGLVPVRLSVNIPEDHPEVTLTSGGSLEIIVPELGVQQAIAHAELRGADGELYSAFAWNQITSRFPFHQDTAVIRDLPPGTWSVLVTAEDGRSWSGLGSVAVGTRVRLRLE